jgi:hypothetical protein
MKKSITLYFKLFLGVFIFLSSTWAAQANGIFATIDSLEKQPSSLNRDTLLIQAYYDAAMYNLFQDFQNINVYGQRALKLAENREWKKGILLAYDILGTYHIINGDFDIVTELATENMSLAGKLNQPLYEAHSRRLLAEIYGKFRPGGGNLPDS